MNNNTLPIETKEGTINVPVETVLSNGLTISKFMGIASSLEFAIVLAARVHAGQKDKSDQPYITHPLRVMLDLFSQGYREEVLIAAVLHDTVEDTDLTLEKIEEAFGPTVASLVDAVSRREGETYKDFIHRAKQSPYGRIIKIADIKDNMRPERFVKGLEGLHKRYLLSLEILGA